VSEAKVNSAPKRGERILDGIPLRPIANDTSLVLDDFSSTKRNMLRLSLGLSAVVTTLQTSLPALIWESKTSPSLFRDGVLEKSWNDTITSGPMDFT